MFRLNQYKSISDREDQTTKWWKENKTFEKSIDQRSEDNQYSFLDGPPFVTGMPHYGHLVGRIAKDLIPRYQTMKGKRVRRVWGWDCHGLPVEEKVEKKIGLKNRRDIETHGINKFLEECNCYVEDVSSEWEWYVDKIGEWIDFKNSYKTLHTTYMESIIWIFKQLWDKGLIYEGVKTLLYCTRCGTPVSKFEISMDDSYTDMNDPAITIEFPITTEGKFKEARILAWTTTPWTLPSNVALVVNPKETYIEFKVKGQRLKVKKNSYIAAKKRMKDIMRDDKYKIVKEFKGKELIGLSYDAPFDYFKRKEADRKVYEYKGMVTMDEGTGVVHASNGFGEIDTEMGKHYNLSMMNTVDDAGNFVDKVKDFAGMYVKKADKYIIEYLEKNDLLFKSERITHRYPFCYRCETPLIQKAQEGWFINIQDFKKELLKQNKKINWIPEKLTKRFVNTIKTAPDWNISRTRYWATIMPIWKCDKCEEIEVFGSIKEIEDRSGQKVKNLHRDGTDHIEFECKKCKGTMKRIPEVLDVWFESGSMPYGQIHYPFENKELFKQTFPADYIIEYVGQIRAWFYYMHVVSNLVQGENSFINVVNTGTLAGTDGRKMSKSLGNYPDPRNSLEKYGGDSLRLYFMSNPVMLGEDPSMDEEEWRKQISTVVFPLYNSFKYFVTYANLHNFKPVANTPAYAKATAGRQQPTAKYKLDKWILARLKAFHEEVETNLDKYFMPQATRAIAPFVNDLSTWYIRRSRDRFVTGDKDALKTLYYVLVEISKIAAPTIPFVTEEIYQRLVVDQFKKEPESVHLCDWPVLKKPTASEKKLLEEMQLVRDLASLGQAARVESRIKVRQPLGKLSAAGCQLSAWMKDILKDELNVKDVTEAKSISKAKGLNIQEFKKLKVALDINITDELRQEGLLRELARTIQDTRKKLGFKQEDKVNVSLETDSEDIKKVVEKFNKELCNQTNSKKVELGIGKKEVTVNGNKLKIDIMK